MAETAAAATASPPSPPAPAPSAPPPRRQQIFTDGSFWDRLGIGGCAFVAFVRENHQWEGKAFTLGTIKHSDVAEAQAISYALSWAIANADLPCDEFVIRTDCRDVYSDILRLLKATKDTDGLVGYGHELAEAILWKIGRLNDLRKMVRFEWVPSHTAEDRQDAEGNRIADFWARKMTEKSREGYGLGQWEEDFFEFAES